MRLYEDEGLIVPGRCSNGYRDYCRSTVDLVLVIRSLLEAGLPVRLIRKVLPRFAELRADLYAAVLDELARLIALGVYAPGAPQVHPLADGPAALRELASGCTAGKLAIDPWT